MPVMINDLFKPGTISLSIFSGLKGGMKKRDVAGIILGQWGVHPSGVGEGYQITETTTGYLVGNGMTEDETLQLALALHALGHLDVSLNEKGDPIFADKARKEQAMEIIREMRADRIKARE